MDGVGEEFHRCMDMIGDRSGATPLVIQLPWGVESDFRGVSDLVKMRALLWQTEGKGDKYDVVAIPHDHLEAAREWRDPRIATISPNDAEKIGVYPPGPPPPNEEHVAALPRAPTTPGVTPPRCAAAFTTTSASP